MALATPNSGYQPARQILIGLAIAGLVVAWIYGHRGHSEPIHTDLPGAFPGAAAYSLSFSDPKERLYLFDAEDARGKSIGYVTVAEGRGYGGPMAVATGWSLLGIIHHVKVLHHKEDTPWFRVLEDRKFYEHFEGRKDTEPLVFGRDIDAVSGATCSASGVAEGVSRGRDLVAKKLGHEIPKKSPPPVQFDLAEGLLFLGLGLSLILRYRPVSIPISWRRTFVLLFGFLVLGVWAQKPLSLVNFATWLVGYAPPWQSHLFLYGLVFGVLLLVIFAGRNFYCFWLCPFSAIQEASHLLTGSNLQPSRGCADALRQTRYILLWTALLLAFVYRNPSITVYEPWAALFTLKGTTEQWILVGLTLIAALLVHNVWCSYLCPVGALMELFMRFRHRVVALWQGRKC